MRSTKDMLLKIFRYGKGNGDSAISYLLSAYTSAKKSAFRNLRCCMEILI